MTKLEQARIDREVATRALHRLQSDRESELNDVRARYAPTAADAVANALQAAMQAYQDAENEAVENHEWEKRIVTRKKPVITGSGRVTGCKILRGVVFTYRHGADLGRGGPYRPVAGEPMVRVLKKDGTPGMTVERLLTPRYDLSEAAVYRWALEKEA